MTGSTIIAYAIGGVAIGLFIILIYYLRKRGKLEEKVADLTKENKRLRGKTASASILNIWDLGNMKSRVLFDVAIDSDLISGKRIKPEVWREKKGNLWDTLRSRREKSFEYVELQYRGPRKPSKALASVGQRKLMVASIREGADGQEIVTPLLEGDDIEEIKSGRELWRLIQDSFEDMEKENLEFVKEVIERWRKVAKAMHGDILDIEKFAGEYAAKHDDALEAFLKGWKKVQERAGKYKKDKLTVATMGKILTKWSDKKVKDIEEKMKEAGIL